MDTTVSIMNVKQPLQLRKQVFIQDRKRTEPQILAMGHPWCEKVYLEPIAYLGMQYNDRNSNHLKNVGLPL